MFLKLSDKAYNYVFYALPTYLTFTNMILKTLRYLKKKEPYNNISIELYVSNKVNALCTSMKAILKRA